MENRQHFGGTEQEVLFGRHKRISNNSKKTKTDHFYFLYSAQAIYLHFL